MTEIGAVIDGKYEILTEIGRGGMSVVYLAMDKRLNKQWAVKEVRKRGTSKNDEIVVNSLMAEANLIKRLDHPAFPRIVDIIDNGETIYIVMDYIEGESLDKILLEHGPQPEKAVINWAMQICDALNYLHSQKPHPIIYRDMKPGNLMLKPEGEFGIIKIIDFGIAREFKDKNLADTTVLGTRGYASPEHYAGHTDVRSDIFSLGMTMHHLLTGVDPRKGEQYASVRNWNPSLSEGIEIIVDKCTQPAPENRYQSCSELLQDLYHPEALTKDFRRRQRGKLIAFLAAAGLSLVLLGAGFGLRALGSQAQRSNYNQLLQQGTQGYLDAMDVFPNNPEAYERLLDQYEEYIFANDSLSQQDYASFTGKYTLQVKSTAADVRNDARFMSDPEAFAEINYRFGAMCFANYEGGNNIREQINSSYRFFQFNHVAAENDLVGDYNGSTINECYYQICDFYKQYILNQTADGASPEKMGQLIRNLNGLLDQIEPDPAAPNYEKLQLYKSIVQVLYNTRRDLALSGFAQQDVTNLFNRACDAAAAMELSDSKALQQQLQQEILEHRESYLTAIRSEFESRGGGSDNG